VASSIAFIVAICASDGKQNPATSDLGSIGRPMDPFFIRQIEAPADPD
jgi:hypothetical protein